MKMTDFMKVVQNINKRMHGKVIKVNICIQAIGVIQVLIPFPHSDDVGCCLLGKVDSMPQDRPVVAFHWDWIDLEGEEERESEILSLLTKFELILTNLYEIYKKAKLIQ